MTLADSVTLYSSESLRLTDNLVNYYKKREEMEVEHQNQMQALCRDFLHKTETPLIENGKPSKSNFSKSTLAMVLETSLWKSVVDSMVDTVKTSKEIQNTSSDFLETVVVPMEAEIAKWSSELKNYQAQTNECVSKISTAQKTLAKATADFDALQGSSGKSKEKGLKGIFKNNKSTSSDKDSKAKDVVRQCEEARNNVYDKAKEQMTSLYEVILNAEECRIKAVKNIMSRTSAVSKDVRQSMEHSSTRLVLTVEQMSYRDDLQMLRETLMDQAVQEMASPTATTTNSGRMGVLQVKRGDANWMPMYLVLQDLAQKLFIYEKKEDLQPKDVLDLKLWQAHNLDNSYFKRSFCFQIVTIPKDYDVITQKNKEQVQTINFAASSAFERIDWLQDLNSTCFCCTKCTKYYYDIDMPDEASEFNFGVEGPEKSLDSLDVPSEDGSDGDPISRTSSLHNSHARSLGSQSDLGSSTRSPAGLRPSPSTSGMRGSSVNKIKSARSSTKALYSTENMRDQEIQPRRSMALSIMNFRDLNFGFDLGFDTLTMASAFYIMIFSDNIKLAKTETATLDDGRWEEEFHFDFVPPCHQYLRLIVFASTMNGAYQQPIAYANLRYQDLKSGVRIEDWVTLTAFTSESAEKLKADSPPAIKVAVQFNTDQKLSNAVNDSFLELVVEPTFSCVKILEEFVGHQREEFARAFVNVLVAQGCEVEGLMALLENEVNSAQSAKILFRGNSITTKAVDYYMKLTGNEYLYNTLHTIIEKIYKANESFEVDPSRISAKKSDDKDKIIKKHIKGLLGQADEIMKAIVASEQTFPPYLYFLFNLYISELSKIFNGLKTLANEKFSQYPDVPYTAVSGFLFLRFFCAAVLSPKLFNLTCEHPPEGAARLLTLNAKILQNLSNLTEFQDGGKEVYMIPCDTFISSNIPLFKNFVDTVTSEASANRISEQRLPRLDLKHNTAVMARIFSKHISDFKALQMKEANPKLSKMMPILYGVEVQKHAADVKVNKPQN